MVDPLTALSRWLPSPSVCALMVSRSLSVAEADLSFRLQAQRFVAMDHPIGYFHLTHSSPRLPQASISLMKN